MPHPLFVYGTLHPDRAPAAIAPTVRTLRELCPGTVLGRLFHLPGYPGLHLDVPDPQPIPGTIFTLPSDSEAPAILARLDAYEGFDPLHPTQSLFLRQLTDVTLPTGATLPCWIYIYNGPLP